MTEKGKRKDEDLVKQATKPIPVMTESESIATTARDFNVTSGAERSSKESDTEIDTGITDIGSTPSRTSRKGKGKRGSRSSSGKEESDLARSDADTPALLTDESGGTSAASGSEKEETSESKGTTTRSRTRDPDED